MDFDTEKFILEIKQREAIWNSEAAIYKDRDIKWRQWEELVAIFGREKMSPAQKKHLANELQKKWKNIRDNFVKTRREIVRNNGAVTKKSTYMYYNNLMFLKDTVSVNPTETKTNKPDDNHVSEESKTDTSEIKDSTPLQKKKKRKENAAEGKFANVNDMERSETKNHEEGDDRLFFLSLVSDFKKVPEHLRLRTKAKLINVIAEAQACRHYRNGWDVTRPFHAGNIKGSKTYERRKQTSLESSTLKQTADRDDEMSTSADQHSQNGEASGTLDGVDLFSDD